MNIPRRNFITLLGGAVAAWPPAAHAQQPAMPVVGFLSLRSPETFARLLTAFRQGLSETGYAEGRNLTIEYRWAEGQNERLPALAADLAARHVAVIAAPGPQPALAAKAATTTIPVVFTTANDPVADGLVASFNRPGGNVTGVTSMNTELAAKQLELLHELLPGAERFAVLVTPSNPLIAEAMIKEVQAAASTIGRQIEVLYASSNREIDATFGSLVQKKIADALLVAPDALLLNRRLQLVTLATRYAVPAIYPWREAVEIGGLMSYGSSYTDLVRQAGIYTGRILNGEKPAEQPVLRASKFEFLINLQTAIVLGLEFPPTLLARADEVIE